MQFGGEGEASLIRSAYVVSYIKLHCSSELANAPRIVTYCYEKTRGADHLRNFYSGLQEIIHLTCDAFSAYPCFAGANNGLIVLTGSDACKAPLCRSDACSQYKGTDR